MVPRNGHSRRWAERKWWAFAARLLALVLALSLVAPVTGHADDLAFHGNGHRHAAALTTMDASPDAGASDIGLACHLHCGCHQAAPAAPDGPAMPCLETAPAVYARLSETSSSVAPGRLPRPPRA
jgi:hypothetical protein